MKNIISLRISSIEFPNTYYTFSRARQNTSFTLYYNRSNSDTALYQQLITIDEGNYSPEELVDALNLILVNNPVSLSYNSIKGKLLFDSQYCSNISIYS